MGFSDLSNNAQGALVSGGANILGALLQAHAEGKISDEQLAQELNARRSEIFQNSGNQALDYSQGRDQTQRLGYSSALDALQDPHKLAQGRQQNAVDRALLFGGPGGGPQQMRPPGNANAYMPQMPNVSAAAPFYSDEAMLASEEPFWNAIGGVTEGKIRPNLTGAGFNAKDAEGAQGRVNRFADERESQVAKDQNWVQGEMDRSENQSVAALNQALEGDEQKDNGGGGFWSKLGRFGLGAAGILGAPFTGGLSLAAIPAAIGMGGGGGGQVPPQQAGLNTALNPNRARRS